MDEEACGYRHAPGQAQNKKQTSKLVSEMFAY